MKIFAVLLITSFFIISAARAQTYKWLKPKYEWLKPKLATADTIVLASHEDFGAMIDTVGNGMPIPDWVIDGHPNYRALLKHRTLTPAQRVELSRILLRPFRDNKIVTMHCCQPHNIVFLVRKGHTSYLDICFGCRCLRSSKDLDKLYAFDDCKWSELRELFDKLGLAHEF